MLMQLTVPAPRLPPSQQRSPRGCSCYACHRGRAENHAAALLFHHGPREIAHERKARVEIGLQRLFKLLLAGGVGGLEDDGAHAVRGAVDATELLYYILYARLNLCRDSSVDAHRHDTRFR